MKLLVKLLLITLFLSGCSKMPLRVFEKDRFYEMSLLNTKKAQLINSFETKATIIATYLNPLDDKIDDKEMETFLVGVYIDNDFSGEKKGLNNPLYRLSLNGEQNLIRKKKLDENDIHLKLIPIVKKWFDYYLIEFPKTKSKELKITFENEQFGKVQLVFSKEE